MQHCHHVHLEGCDLRCSLTAGIILALALWQQQCFNAGAAKLDLLHSLQKGGVNKIKPLKQVKSADQAKEHYASTLQKRRQLQQQSANQYNACPMADYVYSGPTMDSIFDELTVDEFQSAIEFVVRSPPKPS